MEYYHCAESTFPSKAEFDHGGEDDGAYLRGGRPAWRFCAACFFGPFYSNFTDLLVDRREMPGFGGAGRRPGWAKWDPKIGNFG